MRASPSRRARPTLDVPGTRRDLRRRPPGRSSSLLRSTTTERESDDAMKELIERALDARTTRLAPSYADVRVVERADGVADRQERRPGGATSNVERRLRRPRPGQRRVGLQLELTLELDEVGAHRARGGRDRAGVRHRRRGSRSSSTTRRPSTDDLPHPVLDEDPFAVQPRRQASRSCSRPMRDGARRRRRDPRGQHDGRPRAQDVRVAPSGARIEQEIVEAGGGIEATAVNDSRDAAAQLPELVRRPVTSPAASRRSAPSASPTTPRRPPSRRSRCSMRRSARPARWTLILDSTAGRAPDPRVVRPSDRARPRARHGGELRGDELPDHSTSSTSLRYGSELVNIDADATAPGGLGTFGYDDEGVPAQKVPIVTDRAAGRLPHQPRDGADHRSPQHGQQPRLGLERHPADPHDERQPAARRRRHASTT